MSSDISLFKTIEDYIHGIVAYGDGGKAHIIGKGKIEIPILPILHDVLYVDGLKANLLNINQICDDGVKVCFSNKM